MANRARFQTVSGHRLRTPQCLWQVRKRTAKRTSVQHRAVSLLSIGPPTSTFLPEGGDHMLAKDKLNVIHPCATGIDVHKMQVTATIRRARQNADADTETRKFNALRSGLAKLALLVRNNNAFLGTRPSPIERDPSFGCQHASSAVTVQDPVVTERSRKGWAFTHQKQIPASKPYFTQRYKKRCLLPKYCSFRSPPIPLIRYYESPSRWLRNRSVRKCIRKLCLPKLLTVNMPCVGRYLV